MKLRSLDVRGFGRIVDRTFEFQPGLNVIYGPNEAGKSTLAAAIIASLYGLQRGDKDRRRPWNGAPFAASLTYATDDGAVWEVRREFADGKSIRVYDADGNDVAARVGDGRSLVPGQTHLGISHEVFTQTACALQREVALDRERAEDVSAALARALGGGPREDAAIGAIKRLDDALRRYVGTARATKNAPLKELRAREAREAAEADAARASLAALSDLRERIATARADRERDRTAAAGLERRMRALRAAHLRARIDALREYREERADLEAARAAFDDVADFPAERVSSLDDAYHAWRSAQHLADVARRHAEEEALSATEVVELAARRRDAGTLDDEAYAAVRAAAERADAARGRAAAAANDAAAARRDGDGGRTVAGMLLASALAAIVAAVGTAIAHVWIPAAIGAAVAIVLCTFAASRARARAARGRAAEAKQRLADAALAEENQASAAVAAVLQRLGLPSMDELVRCRERYVALVARDEASRRAEARARDAAIAADAEARRFDASADALAPDASGSRDERRKAAALRGARKRERDGLEASLAMSAMKRSTILGTEDEIGLEREYAALLAAGVEPADDHDGSALAEAERARYDARARAAEQHVASLEGELRRAETHVPDVAEVDERLAFTRAEIARIEAFERAATLARDVIETRKEEAHRAFARRLEEYGAAILADITAGRYREIRLDPATLAIAVRVPETGALEALETLSAGTRDQIALVVRFATARMFAEGLETPPLLLDDPFAFWDAERIARCLPVLLAASAGGQCLLFTASAELAAAAERAGAHCLPVSASTAASVFSTCLDGSSEVYDSAIV